MDNGASWTTIAMILMVVVGCILTVFLGYLVRSAYDMRLGLKAQLDRGLRQVEEESSKKSKQLRQELGSDIERARNAILEEARKRLGEAAATVETKWSEFEKSGRQERVDTAMSLDALRDDLAALTHRIDDLERELLVGGGDDDAALMPVSPPPTVTEAMAKPGAPKPGTATTIAPLRFEPRSASKVAAG